MRTLKELIAEHAFPVVFAFAFSVLCIDWLYASEIATLKRKIVEMQYAVVAAQTVCIITSKHNLGQE
ncbi:MAG: hypothetical protein LBF61_02605 [Azoarcus sp.]|jgi:hypothetical protein|nr:hypothetical protein [Azoarcus sp.]